MGAGARAPTSMTPALVPRRPGQSSHNPQGKKGRRPACGRLSESSL
jgi:hypothetical protein